MHNQYHLQSKPRRLPLVLLGGGLLLALVLAAGPVRGRAMDDSPARATAAAPAATNSPLFGVVFISSAEDRAPGSGRTPPSIEQQYDNGRLTGAT